MRERVRRMDRRSEKKKKKEMLWKTTCPE